MSVEKTFHRRNLPQPAVSFSSTEGKALFNEALQNGFMEGYFRLAEHFITQGHPAFCGIGSLTMSLNSLLLDPKRVWQGVWRWFDESMLSCCEPLDVVKLKGITLAKLGCLAKCNGAKTTLKYGSNISVDEFRQDIVQIASLPAGNDHTVMIVSYYRTTLKQSGSGHFSPIGGYCPTSDMVLIMDVARFKYPPHWVPLILLYEALQAVDPVTGRSRGYMLLSAGEMRLDLCECSKTCREDSPEQIEVDVIAAIDALKVTSDGDIPSCCKSIESNVSAFDSITTATDNSVSSEVVPSSSTTASEGGITSNESAVTEDSSSTYSRSSSPTSGMHIPDDGMQCTFNPDGSGSSHEGTMYTPQELLHLFLNHTCKYCEKQSAIDGGNCVRSTPFVAVID